MMTASSPRPFSQEEVLEDLNDVVLDLLSRRNCDLLTSSALSQLLHHIGGTAANVDGVQGLVQQLTGFEQFVDTLAGIAVADKHHLVGIALLLIVGSCLDGRDEAGAAIGLDVVQFHAVQTEALAHHLIVEGNPLYGRHVAQLSHGIL